MHGGAGPSLTNVRQFSGEDVADLTGQNDLSPVGRFFHSGIGSRRATDVTLDHARRALDR